MPDIVGKFQQGAQQPVINQLNQLKVEQAQHNLDTSKKKVSLAEYQAQLKERELDAKADEALRMDFSKALSWAGDDPSRFEQVKQHYGQMGLPNAELMSFENRGLYQSKVRDPSFFDNQQYIDAAVGVLPEDEQPAGKALGNLSPKTLASHIEKRMLTPIKTIEDDLKLAKSNADREEKLRKEHSKESKVFTETKQAYTRMMASEDTSAGDMSLIFQYMKMLDPGSTVREGEFATAEQVGGASEKYRNLYNKTLKGDRLTPRQREQFMNEAGSIYEGLLTSQEKRDSEYRRLAKNYDVSPENVVLERSKIKKNENIAPDGTRYKKDGKTFEKQNGQWVQL